MKERKMSVDESRRQKKLMKRRQKHKLRRKNQAGSIHFELLSARKKILFARKFPFYECLINPSWKDQGLATILISRRQPDGDLVFGLFLVDIYCLGLKNTFCNADFSLSRYKTELLPKIYLEGKPVQCPIPLAHQIIYGGIAFAQQFGFEPNKDFKLSQYVLDDKDSIEPCEDVEFGKDGKPFFIAGPDDNVEHIIRQLESRVGKGNFEYLVRVMPHEHLCFIE
jgi:hypothetical protein